MISGLILWGKAGFAINFTELSTTLFGTKPWNLGKDSYFFYVILGVVLTLYSGIELNLKRWEKE